MKGKRVFFLLFFLLLNLISYGHAYFSVQTDPPPRLGDLRCDCSAIESCTCSLGNIQVGLVLHTEDWERFADVRQGWFGRDVTCSSGCIGAIGEVVTVSLPFLKFETLEEAHRTATATIKKSMSFSEKIIHSLKSVFSSLGSGTESDSLIQILKEKSISSSTGESEKVSMDLTTYFVLSLTKDVFITTRPSAIQVAYVIDVLNDLANKGELAKFLSFYFYLRERSPELVFSSNLPLAEKAPISPFALYVALNEKNEKRDFKQFIANFLTYRFPVETEKEYIYYRKNLLYGLETLEEIKKTFEGLAKGYEKLLGVNLFNVFEKIKKEKAEKGKVDDERIIKERISNYGSRYLMEKEKALSTALEQIKQSKPEGRERKNLRLFFIFIPFLVFIFLVIILRKKFKFRIKIERQ